MKCLKISLMIIVLTIIFSLGCIDKSNIVYGKWIATRKIAYTPISAMSEEDFIKNFKGQIAIFNTKKATFIDRVCKNPIYKERVVLNEDFFNGYHLDLKDIGIKSTSIKIVEIYENKNNNWINPGSTLIIKDQETLISLWDGLFFELKRLKKF